MMNEVTQQAKVDAIIMGGINPRCVFHLRSSVDTIVLILQL
jgi:hypothetical protein